MNEVTYRLNRTRPIKELDDTYLEDIYQYYLNSSKQLKCKVNINKYDFEALVSMIYNILMIKINGEQFDTIMRHYLVLLLADAKDGHDVNVYWFIDHAWYLYVGLSKQIDTKVYKDCIPFIQTKLIQILGINENIKEKINRKIYTRIMLNC